MQIGASKKDTNAFIPNHAMFGYGDEKHVMKGIDLPIYARAFVIKSEQTNNKIAIVVIELAAISDKLKKVVAELLSSKGFTEENIMISATHTHSAPGGHFGYLLYDLTAGGFHTVIFDRIVSAITHSIIEADENTQDATIFFAEGDFDTANEVVFNASLKAYNNNPDATKYGLHEWHLATDRTMALLRFEGKEKKPIGSINWFGVHTTSIGKDHYKLSSDNKGYAALLMEQETKSVSAFAQKPCADTSPNFRWNSKRNKMCGKYDDDYESAKYNGHLQFKKAKELFNIRGNNKPLEDKITYHLKYVDLSNTHIDADFLFENETAQTAPAALGAAFARGMTDGFGLDNYSFQLLKIVSHFSKFTSLLVSNLKSKKDKIRIRNKYKFQGNKAIFLETTQPSIFNLSPSTFAYALSPFDKLMKQLKSKVTDGSIQQPWTPHLLPIQLITIGDLALCGVPAEISVTAGKRLKNSCLKILKNINVNKIIIAPYSNSYSGYITTPEEYDVQAYEGGHTMFGRYTLPAYQTHFKQLCLEAMNAHNSSDIVRNNQLS